MTWLTVSLRPFRGRHPLHRMLFPIAAVLASGCKSTDAASNPISSPGLSVNLTPASAEVPVGNGIDFTISVSTSADGTAAWSSNAPFVTISPGPFPLSAGAGHNTASCVQIGRAIVSADVQVLGFGRSATAGVACDSAHADPKTATVGSAGTLLTASGTGSTANVSVSNANLTWTADNKSIISVTPAGLATPVSPGATGVSASLVVAGTGYPIATGVFFVTGNGACSLNPNGPVLRTLTFRVQSDPGNHATQVGFPTSGVGPLTFGFGSAAGTNMQVALNGGPSAAPFVGVSGGWVTPTDCGFVANGQGDIAGVKNVGVRLEGVWTNGALNLKYTVGTNGELSGGPVVYTVTG